MNIKLILTLLVFVLAISCKQKVPESIDLSANWQFSPDEKNMGSSEKWYDPNFDDSQWDVIDAGKKWEDQGYPDLDSYGWYRKTVDIPEKWKGRDIWLKIGAVNDAYELYVNDKSV